jgi:hypothetical protein
MNKSKFLTISVIALLVCNLFLIGFILWHKPGKHERNNPRNFIIEKLDLTENQIEEYEILIASHKPLFKEKRMLLHEKENQLYMLLQGTAEESAPEVLSNEIGTLQRQIEILQYNHFKDIKALCKPNQIGHYNELMTEISRVFSPPRHKGRK